MALIILLKGWLLYFRVNMEINLTHKKICDVNFTTKFFFSIVIVSCSTKIISSSDLLLLYHWLRRMIEFQLSQIYYSCLIIQDESQVSIDSINVGWINIRDFKFIAHSEHHLTHGLSSSVLIC